MRLQKIIILNTLVFTWIHQIAFAGHPEKFGDLTSRIANAINQSMSLQVVHKDHLGEGSATSKEPRPNVFDSDPRSIENEVNCMTWIQWVLSVAYANPNDKISALKTLDHLRYFFGSVSFGTREHYNEDFALLSDGPLRPITSIPACGFQKTFLSIDRNKFKQSIHYKCPLFLEEKNQFNVALSPIDKTLKCAQSLKPGMYLIYPTATEKYLKLYGKEVGKMGLVHGLFLQVPVQTPQNIAAHILQEPMIFHASITYHKVVQEYLSDYIKRTKGYFGGFTFFELDPKWSPDLARKPTDSEFNRMNEIKACESKL